MSGHSLASLLQLMNQRTVTEGWGAVSVFNRSRLNRLLEQQYIKRFNGLSFMPPLSGALQVNTNKYDFVELKNISLGQPLLSFNSASLINSTAVVTMNIIAGRYTASNHRPGAEKTLTSTFDITESHGFTLVMDIDLSLVVGEVDRQGKVTLNLSEGANFRCNLAGDDEATNTRLSTFFKESFAALPPHRSVFQLGMLDLKGYNHLTPKSFRIVTQAAPGAKVRGALNYGDGGVVVLIQLRGNTGPGRFPPSADFPFLIPNDQESNGNEKYSAALVLSEAMVPYIENNNLEVLNNLLFPGEHVFEERERHAPRDLAVFGNIKPKQTLITLEPAFKTIKAGDKQTFTLRNWKGEVIQASNWQAVSLSSHTTEAHGTIAGGVYTAASPTHIGQDALHVVVTADYGTGNDKYTASALLMVVFDSMTIVPKVGAFLRKAQTQSMVLNASTVNDVPLNWKLLAPQYGTLTQSGKQALFTPDARAKAKGLAVQNIEATGTETRQAAVLLLNAEQLLRVNPAYVPAVRKSAGVQLKDDPTLLPGVARRWKVIGGGGTVDASGKYTAPAQGATASSVVQCEIVRNGVVFSSGYSVIGLSELEPEPTWKDLSKFTIRVPGGLDNGRLGSMFPNGYQQMRAEILVETALADNGKAYPLSVTEKASMRLVDDSNNAEIEFVVGDGIPEGDLLTWRTGTVPNDFELAFPRSALQDPAPSADPPPITKQDVYLHTRAKPGSTTVFHAMFQADSDNRWWKSTDKTDQSDRIEITPLPLPKLDQQDYTFTRQRITEGVGPQVPETDDDFDFYLRSVDYWALDFVGRPGTQGALFVTMEFLPYQDKELSTTAIRWESEQLWETMFSWTGSFFEDPRKPVNLPKIKFDEATKHITKNLSLDLDFVKRNYKPGTLVMTLHRHDFVPYIRSSVPERAKLSEPLVVLLRDLNGNTHKRLIDFLPAANHGSRHRLRHEAI